MGGGDATKHAAAAGLEWGGDPAAPPPARRPARPPRTPDRLPGRGLDDRGLHAPPPANKRRSPKRGLRRRRRRCPPRSPDCDAPQRLKRAQNAAAPNDGGFSRWSPRPCQRQPQPPGTPMRRSPESNPLPPAAPSPRQGLCGEPSQGVQQAVRVGCPVNDHSHSPRKGLPAVGGLTGGSSETSPVMKTDLNVWKGVILSQ